MLWNGIPGGCHSQLQKRKHRMSTEENKAVVHRYIEEAWNKGNVGVIDELVTIDYVRYIAGGGKPLNREGQKQRISSFRKGLPDLHLAVENMIAEGDKVVIRWRIHATHQGNLMGVPLTGKQVTITGIDIVLLAEGKIMEHWGESDTLGLMQQLGVVPAPGQVG